MRGFTFIEVLAALAIAAFALTALIGRLGASTDIQRGLIHQRQMQNIARNLINEEILANDPSAQESSGELQWRGNTFQWRKWTEKTELERFVRRNVAVRMDGEPEFTTFVFLTRK